jgi:ribosomal-protein-alanine N-acetyltransferase
VQPIQIRKAERSDIPALCRIGYEAWLNGILPLMVERPGQRATERARLEAAVVDTIERIVVAEVDDIPVGWCSRARGRAYIPYLFVDPDMQGLGIGSLLLKRMESMLELVGASRVALETPADNVRAVRFYERQGYRILAMRPDGKPGRDPFMSVHLEKALRPYAGPIGADD